MSGAIWRKSTRSNSSGGECVEVAANLAERVLVRDSKDPHGDNLEFRPAAWAAFVAEPPSSKIE
jgi:hypothetical protein